MSGTRALAVALAAAALLGAAGASASPRAVEPTPSGADWTATAHSLPANAGSRLVYVCPANGRPDQVWGTTIYTDDSSVCTAAVHAGLITVADGGIVTIEHLPGRSLVHRLDGERDHERELGLVRPGASSSSAPTRAAARPA